MLHKQDEDFYPQIKTSLKQMEFENRFFVVVESHTFQSPPHPTSRWEESTWPWQAGFRTKLGRGVYSFSPIHWPETQSHDSTLLQ